MKEKSKYLTKNKKIILEYIKKIKKAFNSQELYEFMINNGEKIGLTTIYRYLEELDTNNLIKKFYDSKNTAIYQYVEKCDNDNHFYLKCNKCGILIHIDCDCIVDLQKHILNNHNFKADNKSIIITGICNNCLEVK